MADDINLHNNQYNDNYDKNKKYEMVLFNPDKAIFQSDLNELQSILSGKISALGNSWYKDGAILSGMGVTTKVLPVDDDPTKQYTNLLSLSQVSSSNSKIDISNWNKSGEVDVAPFVTVNNSYPGIQISGLSVPNSSKQLTLSFRIKSTDGSLHNIFGSYSSDFSVDAYTIDGASISNPLANPNGQPLHDTDGNQIILSDGNWHNVVITFSTKGNSPLSLILGANNGYNMLQDGSVSYNLDYMQVVAGTTLSAWSLSKEDSMGSSSNNKTVEVDIGDGMVYLDGEPRVFEAQTVNIVGKGKETIGVSLAQDIVTTAQDPDLADTTIGSMSYMSHSTDRLHYTVNLTYNDDDSAPIVVLQDGKIATNNNGNLDKTQELNDILARRTNDQSGAFLVSGMDMWVEADKTDSSRVRVIVDKGVAYVRGYGIYPAVAQSISVPKSVATNTSEAEPLIYNPSDPAWGELQNQPVQSVSKLVGQVENAGQIMQRARDTTIDKLNNQNIYDITSLYTQADGKKVVYTAREATGDASSKYDYYFDKANNAIVWNYGGSMPHPQIPAGQTYYVDESITKVYSHNDFSLVDPQGNPINSNNPSVNDDGSNYPKVRIKFNNGVQTPMPQSVVSVNYTYFLATADTITLDSDGNLHYLQGQPAPLTQVSPPSRVDPNTLQLGYVVLFPNSYKSITQKASIQRLTMQDMQNNLSRTQNLEDSVQKLSLRTQAQTNQDPLTLQGSFTDNFSSTIYGDFTNRDFNISYDFARNAITLPTIASKEFSKDNENGQLQVDNNASQNIHKFPGGIVTPEFTETPLIRQSLATQDPININPQGDTHYVKEAELQLDPNTDIWTDNENLTNYVNGVTQHINISDWWWHNDTNVQPGMLNGWSGEDIVNNYPLDPGYDWSQAWGRAVKSTKTKVIDDKVQSSIEEWCRPRTVNFTGSGFLTNADGLSLTMDGIKMKPTAANGYPAVGDDGLFKATSDGKIAGNFDIPYNTIKSGVRNVVVQNINNHASTTYQAVGTKVVNTQTILKEETDFSYVDPLSQSVGITSDMGTGYLSSVDLFFASKDTNADSSNNEITVQLRRLGDQGYPTQTVLNGKGTKIQASQVVVSSDASQATNVRFDTPVPFKTGDSFAITILSNSNAYTLYRNTVGMPIVTTSQPSTTDGYPNGVLFESTNSQTWVADEHSDLKFNLNQAIFNPNATLEFQTIELTNTDANGDLVSSAYYYHLNKDTGKQEIITRSDGSKVRVTISELVTLLASLTYSNTGMNWSIKILGAGDATNNINTVNWQPVQNGNSVDSSVIDQLQTAQAIKLKADFQSDNRDTTSPNTAITNLNSISLGAIMHGVRGSYISQNIDESGAPFNALQTTFIGYIPEGTSVKIYYCIDGSGNNWYEYPAEGCNITDLGFGRKQYLYRVRFADQASGDNTTYKNFKIRIDLYSHNIFKKPYVQQLATSMSIQSGDETGTTTFGNAPKFVINKNDPIPAINLPNMSMDKQFDHIDNDGQAVNQ